MLFYPFFQISLFYHGWNCAWNGLDAFGMLFVQVIHVFKGDMAKPKEELKEEAGIARMSIEDGEKLKKSALSFYWAFWPKSF